MTTLEFDVLTIGNAIVDVIARVDEAFVARENLVKGSMNLIEEARAEQLYDVRRSRSLRSSRQADRQPGGGDCRSEPALCRRLVFPIFRV